MDAFAFELDAQRVRLVAFALALGAGHVEIAEELHLDLLEAVAPAAFAAAVAAVEAEEPGRDALRLCVLGFGEELADRIERADIHRGRAARRARERALVHHHHRADLVAAFDGLHAAGFVFDAFAPLAQEIPEEHIVNERALAAAAHARDAAEHAERDVHVEVFQIVLPRADDAQGVIRVSAARRFAGTGMDFASGEIVGGQRRSRGVPPFPGCFGQRAGRPCMFACRQAVR